MKTKETKLSIELAKRIKKEFSLECIPVIHRTYAGHWQKSQGSWIWFMFTKLNTQGGSSYTAKEILKARNLSFLVASGVGLDLIINEDYSSMSSSTTKD